jgi:phosphatidylserine/phosphatidylglycerophosphate/cardiolipin synthase-like enzyme
LVCQGIDEEGFSVMQRSLFFTLLLVLAGATGPRAAAAQDILCDSSFEDCRTRLIQLIDNETGGIDVAFWFMEDARYTAALIRRHNAGVPVRVLMDPRANDSYTHNAARLKELQDAGIPMRKRTASGILHWKMMLFHGQNTVQFSAANYSAFAFTPVTPYVNYTDEAIYFTSRDSIVNTFRTRYDTLWTDTVRYADHANITGPLVPYYDVYPKDPELNFPPSESFRNRSVSRYNAEPTGIDITMYRITDQNHTNAIINAVNRGVPVRLYTEPKQYRDPNRLWHSWNVDRMYMAGVTIRHRAHEGLNHQKSVILHGQGMVIFGSSNWTGPSTDSQEEHNIFTARPEFYDWFTAQFERKWNNTTGHLETEPFVPLPPDRPVNVAPAHLAANQPTQSVTLRWNGGPWAHIYDVYFGTTPNPSLFAEHLELGPSQWTTDHKQLVVSGLQPGTTYYWRVVGRTMALLTNAGPVHSFTTEGTAPPPEPVAALGPGDILIHAARASVEGNWTTVSDGTAAGGRRLVNADLGQPRVSTALASPADHSEFTFTAEAGVPYRLWIRAQAQNNHWANDSVHVQFSGSVTASGAPTWRIGTTSSTIYSLEPCSGCGVSGWGWEDNGWGHDVLGPLVYFAQTGPQTIRFQPREDGISIDQVLLSPEAFLSAAPGTLTNDATIYPESDGSGTPPPPPPPPPAPQGEVVLWASKATIVGADWRVLSDPSAAGGMALQNPDAGRAKVNTASAAPASYVELTFDAEAGIPYRLWIRSRAQNNHWANDSVHVQFSGSVDALGNPMYRIGTTASGEYNLEECSGCGIAGWGWEDNGWGKNVLGPQIFFAASGPQTIRIQTREDGIFIDQILLSPSTYLESSPGTLKQDATILPATGGD